MTEIFKLYWRIRWMKFLIKVQLFRAWFFYGREGYDYIKNMIEANHGKRI